MDYLLTLLQRRIKEARISAGLTQNELAEKMALTGKLTISRYETGERCPTIATLIEIAKATDKELAWFFQDEKQPLQLPPEDAQFLTLYHSLNLKGQEHIRECLQNAVESRRYVKGAHCA